MGIFSKLFQPKDGSDASPDAEAEPHPEPTPVPAEPPRTPCVPAPPPVSTTPSPPDVGVPTPVHVSAPTPPVRERRLVPPPAVTPPKSPAVVAAPPIGRARDEATPRPKPVATRPRPKPVKPPATVPRQDTEPMTVEPPPMFGTPAVAPMRSPEPPVPNPAPARREPPGVDAKPPRTASAPGLSRELDRAFDEVEHHGPEPAGDGQLEPDTPTKEEIERLFREIAAEHARHLRDFAFELSTGDASRHWAELCTPSITTLRRSAEGMQQAPLLDALAGLGAAIEEARSSGQARISGPLRQRLLDAYEALKQALPEAFVEAKDTRRESVIVDALLRLVPGMHRIAIDKLYAAGIDSLPRFRAANAYDLARAAGLELDLCEAVVGQFRRHREERAELAVDDTRSHECAGLEALVEKLRSCQQSFEAAELEEDITGKRRLRNERRTVLLELDLALAQLGELDLVHELERMSVERKIVRLEDHLRAQTKRGCRPPTGASAASETR